MGSKTDITDDYEQIGEVVWSNDEERIAFTAKTGDYYAGDGRYSVLVLELIDDSFRNIIEDDIYFIKPENWIEDNILIISESCTTVQGFDCIKQFLFYDLNLEIFVMAP